MSDFSWRSSWRFSRHLSCLNSAALFIALCGGTSCQSTLYTTTGDIMTGYTVDHVLPTLLQSGDVGLACSTGMAFASFLASFGRVTDDPARASLVSYVSAAFCAEAEAREAELTQLRAIGTGAAGAAQDARIVEKRHHRTAASRFLVSYQQLQNIFGTVGEACPELEPEDETLYLLGLSAGLNAVLHDRAADGLANVPLDIPGAVARATACLDNRRWFGVPHALSGAVWASIPGLAPADIKVPEQLEAAATLGESRGIRLARALQVQALGTAGQQDAQRQALQALAESVQKQPADPQWELFDAMGTLIALHESDKIWTQATGHRTPAGKLGSFYSVETPTEVDDDLLDDLDGPLENTPGGDKPAPPPENPS